MRHVKSIIFAATCNQIGYTHNIYLAIMEPISIIRKFVILILFLKQWTIIVLKILLIIEDVLSHLAPSLDALKAED